MSKNINFRSRSRTEFEIQLKPYPAVKQLPKWFLDTTPYVDRPGWPNDGKLHFRNRDANVTYKKCVPLLDSLSAGYIIPLWTDVMVEEAKLPVAGCDAHPQEEEEQQQERVGGLHPAQPSPSPSPPHHTMIRIC